MTLWPRHNWTLIRGQRRSTPQGTGWCAIKHATAAWKVPLKESSLPEPSSVTLRVILWTPSGPCAPWGASGPATTSPGPPSPSSSSSEILQNEEGTLKKARPRFYKEWDSTKTEILQRTRFSRTRRALWRKPDRDSTHQFFRFSECGCPDPTDRAMIDWHRTRIERARIKNYPRISLPFQVPIL